MLSTTENKKFDFSASSLEEAQKIAEILANSDLVPTDYRGKPNNVLVAVQFGSEIGLKPLQSLQGIAVINGRPCVWGDALLSVAMGHKDFEDIIEENDGNKATCTVLRKGRKPCIRTFSVEDAKQAGLFNRKGPWLTYPQRMLQMRARSWAIRDSFADVLKGIQTREEAEDKITERVVSATVVDESSNMTNSEIIKNRISTVHTEQDTIENQLGIINNGISTAHTEQDTVENQSGIINNGISTAHTEQDTVENQSEQPEEVVEDINFQEVLNQMINVAQIPAKTWSPWLAKAGVSSISELDNDQAKKCIDYLQEKHVNVGKEKSKEIHKAEEYKKEEFSAQTFLAKDKKGE